MPPATFNEWIDAVFDHPVQKREWYWDDDFESFWGRLELSDTVTVEYMTRLFLASDSLKRYSLQQVAQGIWFLIGESSPGQSPYSLLNSEIPVRHRIDYIRAIATFFRVFVVPATPGRADEQKDDFQRACYMWWDIFPMAPKFGPDTGEEPELHGACLNTMAEILSMPSELCQLSALHGLGHWHRNHSERVEDILDSFLERTADLTPRIIDYAHRARIGEVL
jgi:hypothetical protein